MSARADILAGRAVILVNIQDAIDKQLRGIRGKMRVFANSMSEIGGDLFRGGIAGSVASFFPVKSFVDFQDSILFVQAKLRDTGVDVQDLTEYIRELGKTTSFTSKEIAEGAAVLAQAGLGMKVKGTLMPMLDLARSARVDVDTAGRIMANTMRAFDLPVEMAGEIASKLTTAARLGTTDLVLMAESLKYLQTTARGLNIPLDETLALVTHLSNIGMRGSLAGTSLNAALGNLAAKPGQLKEKLGLVIEPEDVEEPLRLFTKLLAATKDMDALTKKATMSSLFNIRGERAFGGIMLQSLESLDDIIKKIKGSTDEAREAAVLMDSRLGGVWRRGLSAAQEFGLAVGSTSEGPLSKFGVAAQKVFQDLSNLAQANPQLVQTILLIPPAALAAGAGLLLMSTMLSKVIMLIGPLITLNAALFKSLAAIVGVNLKAITGTGTQLAMPFIRARAAATAHYAAIERNEARITRLAATYANRPTVGGFRRIIEANNEGARLQNASIFTREIAEGVIPRSVASIGRAFRAIEGSRAFNAMFLSNQPMATLLNMFPRVEVGVLRIADAFGGLGQRTAAAGRSGLLGNLTTLTTRPMLQGMNSIHQALSSRGMVSSFRNLIIHGFHQAARPVVSILEGIVTSASARGFSGRAPMVSTFQIIANQGLRVFGVLFRGLRAGFNAITQVNWLAVMIRGFHGVWSVARGFLSVLNGIRRVLFSLSGWLLIAEVLILFGDKIPIVKDALAGLGRAFSNVFDNIGDTLKNTGASFSLISKGISQMFSGNIESGIQKIGIAFKDMGSTISTGLSYAWAQFVSDIEPGAIMIRNAVKGIIGIFDALVATIGSVFGTVLQGGRILIESDGSLLELFKSIFSPENFQSFFTMIITLIGEIGKGINTALGYIFTALDAIKRTFVSIIQGFNKTVGMRGTFNEALGELDENAKLRANLRANIDFIESMTAFDIKSKAQGDHLRNLLQRFQKELDALGYTRPMANLSGDRNTALEKQIQGALKGIASITDAMKVDVATAKVAADKAAMTAKFRGSAETMRPIMESIGDFLSTVLPKARLSDLLPKPMDMSVIQARIDSALDRREQLSAKALEEEDPSIINEWIKRVNTAIAADEQRIMLQRQIEQGVMNFLDNPPTWDSVTNSLTGLIDGFKEAFLGQIPEVPAIKDAQEEVTKLGPAVKALIGDFESTRGNRGQFKSESLQEKANKHLERIEEGIDRVATNIKPAVFTA